MHLVTLLRSARGSLQAKYQAVSIFFSMSYKNHAKLIRVYRHAEKFAANENDKVIQLIFYDFDV